MYNMYLMCVHEIKANKGQRESERERGGRWKVKGKNSCRQMPRQIETLSPDYKRANDACLMRIEANIYVHMYKRQSN